MSKFLLSREQIDRIGSGASEDDSDFRKSELAATEQGRWHRVLGSTDDIGVTRRPHNAHGTFDPVSAGGAVTR